MPDVTTKLAKSIRRGVFYTPPAVASAVSKWALMGATGVSVLEPSAGDGVFIQSLLSNGIAPGNISAHDVSKVACRKLQAAYPNVDIRQNDYIKFANTHGETSFDLIIGNPPYVRRHNFTQSQKASITRLESDSGEDYRIFKNAWSAFVIASTKLLKPSGTLAFVLPYEFLTVSYGKAVRASLAEKFKRLDVFIPKNKAFPRLDQDAIIVIASNTKIRPQGYFTHSVETLADLEGGIEIKAQFAQSKSEETELARHIIGDNAVTLVEDLRSRLNTMSNVCRNAAGTVTGANDFFILSKSDVDRHGLQEWVTPILKKASYLSSEVEFTGAELDRISTAKPSCLLDFGYKEIEALDERARAYVKLGEQAGLNKRHKTRNRRPWFRVPTTPSGDAYFFKRSHLVPRLVINTAGVQATDTAYRIDMKDGKSARGLAFSFYNSLSMLFCEIDGRFYGGGVLEVTPNEFRGLPVCYMEPSESEYLDFTTAFRKFINERETLFDFGDQLLRQHLQLTTTQLKLIQDSLVKLRAHRLRHGLSSSRAKQVT